MRTSVESGQDFWEETIPVVIYSHMINTWKAQIIIKIKKHFIQYGLTLKVLVATIDAQWEGMGDVGSARYEPALLPPCPTIRVLSFSN